MSAYGNTHIYLLVDLCDLPKNPSHKVIVLVLLATDEDRMEEWETFRSNLVRGDDTLHPGTDKQAGNHQCSVEKITI